jgi:hypothetical protein
MIKKLTDKVLADFLRYSVVRRHKLYDHGAVDALLTSVDRNYTHSYRREFYKILTSLNRHLEKGTCHDIQFSGAPNGGINKITTVINIKAMTSDTTRIRSGIIKMHLIEYMQLLSYDAHLEQISIRPTATGVIYTVSTVKYMRRLIG